MVWGYVLGIALVPMGAIPQATPMPILPTVAVPVANRSPVVLPSPPPSSANLSPTDTPDPAVPASPAETAPESNPEPSTEPNIDDLFEDVFGSPRNPGPQQVVVPILVNTQSRGQGLLILPGGGQADTLIVAREFLAAVENGIRPDIYQALVAATLPDGTLNLRFIRQLGLEVNFDSTRLELQVQVPPELRPLVSQDVQDATLPPNLADALPPSALSGYVNVRGSQDVAWTGQPGTLGRQPLRLGFDGALNVRGWVLEGRTDFVESGRPAWSRGNISLIHDDTQTAIRYQMGDLSVPIQGYQSSVPMLGLTVVRNFSLQPYTITRPISRFEFFLERPSQVEVFVNGQLVQTLPLEAGPQDVRNLPLNAGINGVQLVITDDVGQTQVLDFATGVAGGLLAPGIQQFAYSLGFPSSTDAGGRTYDFSQPTLTLSHRLGITDTATLGGYFQGDLTRQLAGVEGIWASAVGNLGWNGAISHDQSAGVGVASQLFYDLLTQGQENLAQRSLRATVEYRSGAFATLGTSSPNNPTALDLSLAYNQTIFGQMRATLSGRYQLSRSTPTDGYSLALALSQPLAQGISLNLSGSYGLSTAGEREQQLFIGLSASRPQQRQFINASTTLNRNSIPTGQWNWSYNAPVTVGGLSASLSQSFTQSTTDLTLQGRYPGYRATLALDHRLGLPRGQAGFTTANTSRFTWGTALVFADSVVAWSRPIDNSFAIITRQGTAHGQLVQVNPSAFGDIARADALGPGVVPLSPYNLTRLSVEAPTLPLGQDLGLTDFALFPSYRSGIVVRVGSEATVIMRGTLVDEQGNPLGLLQGRIMSLSDPAWPPVDLITNRVGRFAVSGLKPGQYEVRLYGQGDAVARFEIPAGTAGVYNQDLLLERP